MFAEFICRSRRRHPQRMAADTGKCTGTTVYLNTVAGNAQLSNYLDWAKDEVKKRYNITLVHTETPNNTEIISRIMADKIAGKSSLAAPILSGYMANTSVHYAQPICCRALLSISYRIGLWSIRVCR
ncbi:hypothetical protein PCI56_27490 [Plesiomonas shigelloides subsp. oncorhynchi]|nr:hypothetical protein [Plesiomonas shigelloides]